MIAKKRRLEVAHVQTFGQTISLSVQPKASIPDLLGKFKASEDNVKALEGRCRSVVAKTTKERKEAETAGANAAADVEMIVMLEEILKALKDRSTR